ncbi:protein TPR3 isoform X1 [Canna indica]|uniref:Protein TPR3 isoform X1 n=1 Tax=Canna indica TaxID=4628 RepID=A0AAQ3QLJ2_9LILI|nr:protein TPR3 isoform X1 [Canna indica]
MILSSSSSSFWTRRSLRRQSTSKPIALIYFSPNFFYVLVVVGRLILWLCLGSGKLRLEEESGIYFNTRYFEELILEGKLDDAEKYLSGFTKMDDNRHSKKIIFEIRKQKFLEALDRNEKTKALDILLNEIKVFARGNPELFKEMAALLTLENFREHEQLSKYGDTKRARQVMLVELKKLIDANPLLREKLQFPNVMTSRLRHLINQSLNWQHCLCNNSRSSTPDVKSLFVDHSCSQSNGAQAPSPARTIMKTVQKTGLFSPLGPHGPFQPAIAPLPKFVSDWVNNAAPKLPHLPISGNLLGGTPEATAAYLKRPMTPPSNKPAFVYHSADPEHVAKRPRPMGPSHEIGIPITHLPTGYTSAAWTQHSLDELPKTVVMTLSQGSPISSMDFHPVHQSVLLVGTKIGDVSLWEVASKKRISHREFKLWENIETSTSLQAALAMETPMSVNRVRWSDDGHKCAIAYSKHLVHLYTYNIHGELANHLQIEAHLGGVNDVAFSQPNEHRYVITCGDDKSIKVWNAITGVLQYTLEGHEASVCSILPHIKGTFPFIFSTSGDSKINAWLYEDGGPKFSYTAPSSWCHGIMAYSADGTRLFSCGTAKDGTSSIVEWNDVDGTIKRTYEGFSKQAVGVMQFDLIKNKFIAAGDESMVKFWDMNNSNILTTTNAEGGLEISPRVRFNKDGSLLAASTTNNGIKILANANGQLLLSHESCADRTASESIAKSKAPISSALGTIKHIRTDAWIDQGTPALILSCDIQQNNVGQNLLERKTKITDAILEKSNIWKLTEVNEPSQLRYLLLPDSSFIAKVPRLTYTHSGNAVMALASNAVHKLWKWFCTDQNATRKTSAVATTSRAPVLWQPSTSSIPLTNEISDENTVETIHCFALSNNDSYVVSTSGKKISLFNMLTFKTMATFMAAPPAATSFAFHPHDNNIIAVGMEDSAIQIYNVRFDEVKFILKRHQKRITGLAFSASLSILISSGADAQLCAWSLDEWEMKTSKFLQTPRGAFNLHSETKVEFHSDQVHLLVVHETQVAIYDAAKLECLEQWMPRDGLITHATYSCDGQMIYTSLMDGSVNIFTETLRLRCRINPAAYLSAQPSLSGYPLVVAAHPSDRNQFAMGLTDGHVIILEPLESEWGTPPPSEDALSGQVQKQASR